MHRVLIIDDTQAIRDDFRKVLQPREAAPGLDAAKTALFGDEGATARSELEFDLGFAPQGEEGVQRLRAAKNEGRPFAVAFVDMRMPPGWDGLKTIRHLWEVDPDLQVVICTAFSDKSLDEVSATLGRTDRLLILKKPFDPVEVVQLAVALSEKRSLMEKASLKMEELERLVAQRTSALEHAATHDRLTGLPNRALVRQRLQDSIARHRADASYRYALYFLDFDRFKVVNDSLGHDAGDQLLVEIARRLTSVLGSEAISSISQSAFAARMGGDEFVLLVNGLRDTGDAHQIATRVLAALAEPVPLKGYPISPSASIGITTSDMAYDTPSDALRDADNAMYHAKSMGKARATLYDRQMHEAARARLQTESDLRLAVERGELRLEYQPLVCIESGALKGFEALVRWHHPTRGVITPEQFVPAAEDSGEIGRIGRWVLGEACAQLAEWDRQGVLPKHIEMSINVSARQLVSGQIVREIEQALAQTSVSPGRLALEITESAVIADPEFSIKILDQIKQLGVRLHMDDFGTGYTSLSHLHRLPIDALKMDRAFMKSASERREYAAIVHAIVTLAHNLGISVIAEGVERIEQVALLRTMECDIGQGYHFGPPCGPAEAVKYFLTTWRARAA
ncbi:MAG: putative bifunctional diguanylate cyclase/phosphodiesterase [Phycisphaerales bacterium]